MVIQDFFKTIAVHLAVNSVSEVIEAQSALVLRRVPKKAKPKSPSGLSRLVSSSSHDIDKDVQVLQDVSAICDVFFFFFETPFLVTATRCCNAHWAHKARVRPQPTIVWLH